MTIKYLDITDLRETFLVSYAELGTWRLVGERFGISQATANKIATKDYEPRDPKIRAKLGLPSQVMTSVCPRHGIVHRKKCPAKRKRYKDLFSIPVKELRWMIENRKEMVQND